MNQPAIAIQSLSHPLSASVRVPGSKSLTNRALMVSALAEGRTILTNALVSDDSYYFAESLRRLGFEVKLHLAAGDSKDSERLRQGSWRANSGVDEPPPVALPAMTVAGLGGRIRADQAELFVGNAGTAARFLMAMLALGRGPYVLDGDERMRQRPVQNLVAALGQLGAMIRPAEAAPDTPGFDPVEIHLPVTVCSGSPGGGLIGGRAEIAGDVSSQFLSGLLLAAPYAHTPVELRVKRGLRSKPFVDLTLGVMADFGVSVEREGYERFCVAPQAYHSPGVYPIESDATAASYFFAAAAMCGGSVQVEGLRRRSKQGDMAFLDVLIQMGCTVTDGPESVAVSGQHPNPGQPAGSAGYPALRGVSVDMGDIPDTAQTLAAIAPFASTPTTIRGIASARQKETDRVAAMCAELSRLGVRVEEYPDGLTIYPCQELRPAAIQTYQDHRMAMAFALVGLRVPGITILDPGCVSKTFPDYFDVLSRLQP